MFEDIVASTPIIAAAVGAGSALLVTTISFGRDRYVQRLKDGQLLTFVAIRLAAELEDFSIRCALASADHGEPEPQDHGDEEFVARHSTPEFELDYSAYEWRVLPSAILARVLPLPHVVKRGHLVLADVSEFIAGPPFYEEFYAERSVRFGRLGIVAIDIARDLRRSVGASPHSPVSDPEDEYDVREHLEAIVSDALKSRKS